MHDSHLGLAAGPNCYDSCLYAYIILAFVITVNSLCVCVYVSVYVRVYVSMPILGITVV